MSNDDKRTLNDFFPDLERRPQKFIDAERMVNNLESSESAWHRISYLLENNLVNREEIIKRKHYLFELLKLKSKIQLESAGRKSRRELLNDQLSSFVDLLSCANSLAETGLIRKEEYEHLWREWVVNVLESSDSDLRGNAWHRISYLVENNLVNREEIIKRKHYLFELLKSKSQLARTAVRSSKGNRQRGAYQSLLSCADKLAEIGLIRKEEYEHL